MSTYKQIQGTAVQNNAGTLENAAEGQLWYDSTNGNFKYSYESATGAWSTGGSLNTARQYIAGAGTQTAGLVFGGSFPPAATGATESYDGTSFTEINDLNTGRYALGGAGTQTSALGFGGDLGPGNIPEYFAGTESWNGTSWTQVNDLNSGRSLLGGGGADSTSALAFGGDLGPPATGGAENFAGTESWNGTSWTEVNDLNTARQALAGVGIQTAALAFGGIVPGSSALTESWNGTSWTEVNDLNTARALLAGAGIQTAALAFGGQPAGTITETESWNGTSWTEVNDLNDARHTLGGLGIQTAALAFGGYNGVDVPAVTEEWNVPGTIIQTITTS